MDTFHLSLAWVGFTGSEGGFEGSLVVAEQPIKTIAVSGHTINAFMALKSISP